MGIKNINKFIKDKFPNSYEQIYLSKFAYKKIAIDISLYLFKYKAACGDNWLSAFINLVSSLRRNEIHCVFIFDGKAPKEKQQEQFKRSYDKKKMESDIYILENSLDNYYKTGIIEENLKDLVLKISNNNNNNKSILLKYNNKNNDKNNDKYNDKYIISQVEQIIKHKKSQIINILPIDINNIKSLFDILNIPYLIAPCEAEKMCANLCLKGLVDAVLSEDTDLIAYKCPCFLSKIDTFNDTCFELNIHNLENNLEMTPEQILDLCIMSGTDYNNNISNVGTATAYKLLKLYNNIENIGDNTNHDISILNHIVARKLFTEFPELNEINIPFCGQPDFYKLELFVKNNNLQINLDKLKKNFIANIVILDTE